MAENNEKLTVGFTETKEALTFAFALVNGVKNAQEADGKITIGDAPSFFPALFGISSALDNATEIPLEFKLASVEETAELKEWVKANFNIGDDKIEQFIEDAFAVVLDLWTLVNRYILNKETEVIDVEVAPVNQVSEETINLTSVDPIEDNNDTAKQVS